jgi:hypothetical protein
VEDQFRCVALAIGYESDLGVDDFQEKIPPAFRE